VRAAARSAHHEAVTYFEQALAALAQLPECRDTLEQAIDLRFDLYNALHPLGEEAQNLDCLHAAEALAERLGDDRRLGRIASQLGIHFSAMGEHDRAIAACQRASPWPPPVAPSTSRSPPRPGLGQTYYTGGDFRQGLEIARQAMAVLTGEQHSANFGRGSQSAVSSVVMWPGV